MRYLTKAEIETVKSPVEFTPATAQERESCLALKAAGKLRKPKARRDKWVAPELREETAAKLVCYVIRRIEFPRHGEPFPLSPTDKADATQAGMIACVESGFFRHGLADLKVLKAIRNTIQGRECLRMRCKRETPCDDMATLADSIGFATQEETFTPRLRNSQTDMAREIMRTLRAACACDKSRERKNSFQFQRDFFLIVLGFLTGKTPRVCTPHSFDQRAKRFKEYVMQGAIHLSGTRKPANLAKEIMAALSMKTLA